MDTLCPRRGCDQIESERAECCRWEGHQNPGLMDTVMAVSAAIVLGAGGVFALLKFWNELTAWLRDSLR